MFFGVRCLLTVHLEKVSEGRSGLGSPSRTSCARPGGQGQVLTNGGAHINPVFGRVTKRPRETNFRILTAEEVYDTSAQPRQTRARDRRMGTPARPGSMQTAFLGVTPDLTSGDAWKTQLSGHFKREYTGKSARAIPLPVEFGTFHRNPKRKRGKALRPRSRFGLRVSSDRERYNFVRNRSDFLEINHQKSGFRRSANAASIACRSKACGSNSKSSSSASSRSAHAGGAAGSLAA